MPYYLRYSDGNEKEYLPNPKLRQPKELESELSIGSPSNVKSRKIKPEYIIAILGAAATILAALIGVLPQVFKPIPVPTAIITGTIPVTQAPTARFTVLPPSKTPELSLTPAEALTPLVTPLYTEIIDANGVEMVLIPAGTFTMGSNKGDVDEKPVHEVDLSAFYLDKYEVTNTLYKACVDAGVCQQPTDISSPTRSSYYGNPEFDDHPVIYVNWNMAKAYCEWRGARLPTEAEWEKAARGVDKRTYPWGEGISCSQANYRDCVGDTKVVGSFQEGASPYGAYDLAGNVWEWVMDWYSEGYYSISTGTNPHGPDSGTYRIVRGGAWDFPGQYVSSTDRFWGTPQSASANFGFRCARDNDFLPGSTPVAILNRDWQIYSQAGSNSIVNLSSEPGTDYSFRVSFNFQTDGWGAVYKKISQSALVNSQGLIISYEGTGASNTFEAKLIFMDETLCKTVFRRATATQTTVDWKIPYSNFSCSTKDGKPVSLSLDNVDRIDLSLSNQPDDGDVPGEGEVFVHEIQIVPLP